MNSPERPLDAVDHDSDSTADMLRRYDGWAETGKWAEMGAARGIVYGIPISVVLWFGIWMIWWVLR
jgi:hypothetical protein